jgi:hypothetical protein
LKKQTKSPLQLDLERRTGKKVNSREFDLSLAGQDPRVTKALVICDKIDALHDQLQNVMKGMRLDNYIRAISGSVEGARRGIDKAFGGEGIGGLKTAKSAERNQRS